MQLDDLLFILSSVLSATPDKWSWDLDPSRCFSVKSARTQIDDATLPVGGICTRWNSYGPLKVNILFWRILLQRLPLRMLLVERGVELESFICHVCQNAQEDVAHLFFHCDLACQI